MKMHSILITLIFAPALLLSAQTPAPASQKDAAKPAAKKAAVKAEPAAPAPAQEKAAPPQDPSIEALAKIKSADPLERRQAAARLGQLRNRAVAPALMQALSDESPRVRQAAADSLGLLTWREAAPKLSELLAKDTDASVRQQAAISLSYLVDPVSGPALTKALKDSEGSVRYAALHTLGVLRYAPAEDDIKDLLSSKEPNMRRGAIAALGQLQSAKSAPAIVSALKDPDIYVKSEAIKALGNIKHLPAASELAALLDKAEPAQIRMEAALALAKMQKNDGLVTAFEFVKSPELSLRSQALNVIASVGDARSLQFIGELYAAEQDPARKAELDFTRQRLAALLNVQLK